MEAKLAVQSFRDLIVWRKSLDLVVKIYRLTAWLPSW